MACPALKKSFSLRAQQLITVGLVGSSFGLRLELQAVEESRQQQLENTTGEVVKLLLSGKF